MSVIINKEKCNSCNLCILACPNMALSMDSPDEITINEMFCTQEDGCTSCVSSCPVEAIEITEDG